MNVKLAHILVQVPSEEHHAFAQMVQMSVQWKKQTNSKLTHGLYEAITLFYHENS